MTDGDDERIACLKTQGVGRKRMLLDRESIALATAVVFNEPAGKER